MSRETETVEDVRNVWIGYSLGSLSQCEYWGLPWDTDMDGVYCPSCEHSAFNSDASVICADQIEADIIDRVADAVRRECAVGTCKLHKVQSENDGMSRWICSKCDLSIRVEHRAKFVHCPNCGRKVER